MAGLRRMILLPWAWAICGSLAVAPSISNTHMLTLTTAETLPIDDSIDHLDPGNGWTYPKSSTKFVPAMGAGV